MKSRLAVSFLVAGLVFAGCKAKTADNAAAPPPDQSATAPAAPPPAAPAPVTQPSVSPEAPVPAPTPSAAAPAAAPTVAATPVAPPPPPPIVPAGTALTVRLGSALSSKTSHPGDTFQATTTSSLRVRGNIVVPAGAVVSGVVVDAKAQGRFKGSGELDLRLTAINVRGRSIPLQTAVVEQTVKGKGKRTAVTTGGGAGLGALIGGLAGGGKGALIGAGAGAGAGLAGGAFTGNKQIELPAETPVTFRLSSSLRL